MVSRTRQSWNSKSRIIKSDIFFFLPEVREGMWMALGRLLQSTYKDTEGKWVWMLGESQAVSPRPSRTWPLGVLPLAYMVGTCMPTIPVSSVFSVLASLRDGSLTFINV